MKRLLVGLAVLAFTFALPGLAVGYWLASDSAGSAAASADRLPAGPVPVAAVRSGNTVTISVAPLAVTVDDYLIRRYPAGQPRASFAFHCRQHCAETAVADGRWVYTATPELARWHGAEGPASRVIRVDTTAPRLSVTSPAATHDASPLLTGTAGTTPGDSHLVTVRLLSGRQELLARTVAVVAGRWSVRSVPLHPQRSYTVLVRQADQAGNIGQASAGFVLNTVAPSVWLAPVRWPTFAGVAGTAAASTSTSADSATVDVQILRGSTVVQTLTATRHGRRWTVTGSGLATGVYTARAQQRDAAGNVGYSNSRTFTVDATPPAVTIDVLAYLNTPAAVLTGRAGTDPGDASTVAIQVLADATPVQRLVVTEHGGRWQARLAPLAANRRYQVLATQLDAAGNVGSADASFVLDTTAPLVLATVEDSTITGQAGTVAASDTSSADAVTVQLLVYCGPRLVRTVDAAVLQGSFTVSLAALRPGQYQVVVQQQDAAGNLGRTQPLPVTIRQPAG
ncbi:MAG TPA: Ig-like domain-containing protein [Jatrophihabitans sp.]|nr:Ig-like domain-containing protein [Jatrophihabitans sp.]